MGVWTQPSFDTSKLSAGRRCQCQKRIVIAGRSGEGSDVDTFVWYALLFFSLDLVGVRELWFGHRPVTVLGFHHLLDFTTSPSKFWCPMIPLNDPNNDIHIV